MASFSAEGKEFKATIKVGYVVENSTCFQIIQDDVPAKGPSLVGWAAVFVGVYQGTELFG